MASLVALFAAFPGVFNFMAAFMGAMLKPLHIAHQPENKPPTKAEPRVLFWDTKANKRSKAIDQLLEDDAKARKQRCNVLPLGAFSMREIVHQLKNSNEIGLTEDELTDYCYNIHQHVITCTRMLVDSVKVANVQLSSDVDHYYSHLCNHVADPGTTMTEQTGKAINAIWKDATITKAFQSTAASELTESAHYFFENIDRIAAPHYIPTEADILHSHKCIRGISEHRFEIYGLTINVIDVGTQRCERKKWFHQFYEVTAVLFVVDILCYDNETSGYNEMMDRIQLFDDVINAKSFSETTIVLFLSNIRKFRQKLAHSPLGTHFPDYDGGEDIDQAAEYLLGRFKQVDRSQRNRLYTYLVDPYDALNIRLVAAAIKDNLR